MSTLEPQPTPDPMPAAQPSSPAAVAKTITRTCRFEVCFSGLRDADRLALWTRLWQAQDDLTAGANRLMTTLWTLKTGAVPWPVGPPARPKPGDSLEPRPIPLATLAYRGMNGSWKLGTFDIYTPRSGASVGSQALIEAATTVVDRLGADYLAVLRGQQSLATFKALPIGFPAVGVGVSPDGMVWSLPALSEGRGKIKRIAVRPIRLDGSRTEILRRCASGAYKLGSVKLLWLRPKNRKGKWILLVSYTAPAKPAANADRPPLICGVDIGIRVTSMLAFVNPATGAYSKRRQQIHMPANILRAWSRAENDRRERGESNKAIYGLREGRGMQRKLRATDTIGDRVRRIVDTGIETQASAIVRAALDAGATLLAIEDHQHWSVAKMNDAAEAGVGPGMSGGPTRATAAQRRKDYFRWHQGELRSKTVQIAEREGLPCVAVNPAGTSRTCPDCRKVWDKHGIYVPKGTAPGAPERRVGRITLDQFHCVRDLGGCGLLAHADFVAGVNIGRAAIAAPPAPKKEKKQRRKPVEVAPAETSK